MWHTFYLCYVSAPAFLLRLLPQTMSVLASHHNGDLQYNTHNLYGLSEIKSTYEAIQAIKGKRPFVLSRWAHVVGAREGLAAASCWSAAKGFSQCECQGYCLLMLFLRAALLLQSLLCWAPAIVIDTQGVEGAPASLPYLARVSTVVYWVARCRASFTGTGAYAAHWTGDNAAT